LPGAIELIDMPVIGSVPARTATDGSPDTLIQPATELAPSEKLKLTVVWADAQATKVVRSRSKNVLFIVWLLEAHDNATRIRSDFLKNRKYGVPAPPLTWSAVRLWLSNSLKDGNMAQRWPRRICAKTIHKQGGLEWWIWLRRVGSNAGPHMAPMLSKGKSFKLRYSIFVFFFENRENVSLWNISRLCRNWGLSCRIQGLARRNCWSPCKLRFRSALKTPEKKFLRNLENTWLFWVFSQIIGESVSGSLSLVF
jgi:hypothetical protein